MSASDDSLVRMAVAALNAAAAEANGPRGWILVFGPRVDEGTAIYASNLAREGAIDALEQVLEGLTSGDIKPGVYGGHLN